MLKFLVLIVISLNHIICEKWESKCFESQVYCEGLPQDCFRQNISCNTLLIATPHLNDKTVQFELFGRVDKTRQWFAMGLSEDDQMGDDSVTEIFLSSDGKQQALRLSWNTEDHNNEDMAVINGSKVDGITPVDSVVYSDGTLSGKWIRDMNTTVRSKDFDLMNKKYYIFLANGAVNADNTKAYHSEKAISQSKVDLLFNTTTSESPVLTAIPPILTQAYQRCKDNERLCFGYSDNTDIECIDSNDCRLLFSSLSKTDEKCVEIELFWTRDSTSNDRWAGVGLSFDDSMGEDSVTECILESDNTLRLGTGWNPGDHKRTQNVVDKSTSLIEATNTDGLIYCKWSRDWFSTIEGHDFDLQNKSYHLLLAYGRMGADNINKHSKVKISNLIDLDYDSTTSEPPVSTPVSTAIPSTLTQAYQRCKDNERLCFGYSDNTDIECIDSNDCRLLFSSVSKIDEKSVEIELFWTRDSTSSDRWAGVGLSFDDSMGEDSVTECILESDNTMRLGTGWNPGGYQRTQNVVDESTSLIEASNTDGLIYCKWSRDWFSTIEGHDFDLQNKSYHLLLAYGPMSTDNINKHSIAPKISNLIDLQSVGVISAAPVDILIKIHGSLMIIAWLGCVSIAVILARHYKNSWPDSTLCGVKLWFAFHRSLMVSAVLLIIISTTLIFVYNKGWKGPSAHPIVGLTTIILSFLQPIGALFRPNPDSSKRWIFNWLHWSGGYVAQVLAFVTLILATKLESFPNLLPKQFLWILVSFIGFYVLSHILHHLKTFIRSRKVEDFYENASNLKEDNKNRESLFDVIQVLLTVTITLAFVATLVILVYI